MTVDLILTLAGSNSGPFDLYSNINGFTTPFETGVSRSSLLSGYTSVFVPNFTSIIRLVSTGVCKNSIDIPVNSLTTTTTTTLAPTQFRIDWSQGVGTLGMNSILTIIIDGVVVVNSSIYYNIITDTNSANGSVYAYPGQQIDILQEGSGYTVPGIMVLQATYAPGIDDMDTDTDPFTSLSFIMPSLNFSVLAQVNS